MKDLVGVRVANATEQMRIGQCALERTILGGERRAKLFERRIQRFDAARIERADSVKAVDELNRRALLRARLREDQRAAREFEGGQDQFRAESQFAAALAPAEPPR